MISPCPRRSPTPGAAGTRGRCRSPFAPGDLSCTRCDERRLAHPFTRGGLLGTAAEVVRREQGLRSTENEVVVRVVESPLADLRLQAQRHHLMQARLEALLHGAGDEPEPRRLRDIA